MKGQLNAHLDGQKRGIEEPFRAIVWLSREATRPALKMVCEAAEGNQSDVVNARQKSLVTYIRGPAQSRNDHNLHLPNFKNTLILLTAEGRQTSHSPSSSGLGLLSAIPS